MNFGFRQTETKQNIDRARLCAVLVDVCVLVDDENIAFDEFSEKRQCVKAKRTLGELGNDGQMLHDLTRLPLSS